MKFFAPRAAARAFRLSFARMRRPMSRSRIFGGARWPASLRHRDDDAGGRLHVLFYRHRLRPAGSARRPMSAAGGLGGASWAAGWSSGWSTCWRRRRNAPPTVDPVEAKCAAWRTARAARRLPGRARRWCRTGVRRFGGFWRPSMAQIGAALASRVGCRRLQLSASGFAHAALGCGVGGARGGGVRGAADRRLLCL